MLTPMAIVLIAECYPVGRLNVMSSFRVGFRLMVPHESEEPTFPSRFGHSGVVYVCQPFWHFRSIEIVSGGFCILIRLEG